MSTTLRARPPPRWPFSDATAIFLAAESHLEGDHRFTAVGRGRELEGPRRLRHAHLRLRGAQRRAHHLAQADPPAPVDGEAKAHATAQRGVARALPVVAGA